MLRPTQPSLSILSIQDDYFSTPDMLAAQHAFAVRWASYDRGHLYTLLRDGTLHLLPVVQWPPTLEHGFGLRGVQQALRCASATDEALALPRGKIIHAVQNELHLNIAVTEAAPVRPLQYSP